ncbi:hypothetical protein [Bacillus phage Hakuna]|uniref:Uncharacterized protein n=3 Tax=Wphvirus TaxID=1922327 RepID=A0A222Z2V5_9CAUD|nr:hypothetical protein FP72_gp131 [Bacillus phage Hakuna]YP_009280939.1 hypothetical protein SAGEFAYGE_136 [Bacillus phage SageFayge]AHZ10149.1 hypothetical protein [Bacillus phage Hakuna]AMW63056.1 hypothetical protein SAGEFAYGE_136 [Bacillus phage SageFayge]ASR78374.1 hypothetical protein PPISBEST_137 [Bacillus phage PPIsBest]
MDGREVLKGMLINNDTIKHQGIEKVELEFNKDGSILSVFVKRRPEKCGWSDKLSLDAWKLI